MRYERIEKLNAGRVREREKEKERRGEEEGGKDQIRR